MNVRLRASMTALPLVAAALTILLWSSAFPAISYGLRAFSPAELALLRFGIASLILTVPVASRAIVLPPRRDWPAVAVLSLLGLTVYQLSLGYAMTRVPAGAAAVIITLVPGVTAALAALRLGEVVCARMVAGLAVALAGAILVVFGSGHRVRFEPLALLVLVSVLVTSIYFVWQKPLLARTTPLGFTTLSIFFGTIGLLPFAPHLPGKLALVSVPHLAGVVYLAVAPTILGYFAWNWALSRASATSVSSFLYLQPLLAGVIAWLWLGQTMGALAIAGGLLAIGGVALTLRGSRTPARRVTPITRVPAAALRAAPCGR